tara:strand:- start:81 stop:1430 length:1350 start_codon:yes stop_codon:yes gene_type:complete
MQWSLEDIYKKQVRGKIPPRRHLHVLGEKFNLGDAPGFARVRKQLSGEQPIRANLSFIGKQINSEEDIDELDAEGEFTERDGAEKLKAAFRKCREIENEDEARKCFEKITKGIGYIADTHQGELLTNEAATAIRDLVKKSGFDNEQTYNFVKMVLQRYDLDDKLLAKLGTDIENKKVLTEAITEEPFGEVNLYDVMKPQLAFLENEEDRSQVYNEIFSKSFQEGTVGVGDGELAMSLFTEAFKGDVGDLKLPNGLNVEVKTGKARIISSRKGGFKKDRDKFEYLANKSDLSIDDFNMEYNFDLVTKTFQNTEQLKMFLEQDAKTERKDAKTRIQHFGGLMLYEYGRDGNPGDPDSYEASKKGFDILLTVFQKGYKQGEIKGVPNPDRPARMEEGTFSLANYINVKDYKNILDAINSGKVRFLPEGDGIYIFYPGSNTSGAFKAAYQVTI